MLRSEKWKQKFYYSLQKLLLLSSVHWGRKLFKTKTKTVQLHLSKGKTTKQRSRTFIQRHSLRLKWRLDLEHFVECYPDLCHIVAPETADRCTGLSVPPLNWSLSQESDQTEWSIKIFFIEFSFSFLKRHLFHLTISALLQVFGFF